MTMVPVIGGLVTRTWRGMWDGWMDGRTDGVYAYDVVVAKAL